MAVMSPSITRALALLLPIVLAAPASAIIINSEWNTGDGIWNVVAN
jgi:hypothetical protein